MFLTTNNQKLLEFIHFSSIAPLKIGVGYTGKKKKILPATPLNPLKYHKINVLRRILIFKKNSDIAAKNSEIL